MDKAQPATLITEDLLPGDLLFQLRSGGEAEWVISRLFAGRDGIAVNHVAIYDGDGQVIEAIMPDVCKTTLDAFIDASVRDGRGRPCVLVCRVIPEYSHLITPVLEFAEQLVASPYDPHYGAHNKQGPGESPPGKQSWYCSELVVDAFCDANGGQFLFEETPMSFRDMDTGELMPFWVDHYQTIGRSIPEGQPGSHPALLSCSDKLTPVNTMGALPARDVRDWQSLEPGVALV